MSDETTQAAPEPTLKEKNDAAARMAQLVIDNSQSIDRMNIMAELINVFNRAILKQAGRPYWNAADAYLFAQSLSAVDQIGEFDPDPPQQRNVVQAQPQVQPRGSQLEHDMAELTGSLNGAGQRGYRDDSRLPPVNN